MEGAAAFDWFAEGGGLRHRGRPVGKTATKPNINLRVLAVYYDMRYIYFTVFSPQSLTHVPIMSHVVVTSAAYLCLQDFFPTLTIEHMITITHKVKDLMPSIPDDG